MNLSSILSFKFWLSHWNEFILIGISIIAGVSFCLVLDLFVKHLQGKIASPFIGNFWRLFKIPLFLFLPCLLSLSLLKSFANIKDTEILTKFIFKPLLISAFATFIIQLTRLSEKWLNTYLIREAGYGIREKSVKTKLQFIRRIFIIFVIIISLAFILMNYEGMRNIATGVLASAGIISAIMVFAAQNSFANIFAGFQLAFTQPIRIYDNLMVEGEYGQVEEINLTYVVIRIWDGRRLVLPLNYFIQKPFQNWSRSSPDLLGTAMFYLDHTANMPKLRIALTQILEQSSLWDKKVNVLQITDVKEKTIELRALISARNPSDLFDLRCEVREKFLAHIINESVQNLPRTRVEMQSAELIPSNVKNTFNVVKTD
jgi:small-conductance mechanosensitive channel